MEAKFWRGIGKQAIGLALLAEKRKHNKSRKQSQSRTHLPLTKGRINISRLVKCVETLVGKTTKGELNYDKTCIYGSNHHYAFHSCYTRFRLMKRVRNSTVAHHWRIGVSASNHRGTFYTDGKDLYSYNLRVGTTSKSGRKVVVEYRAPWFYSQTTSTHVGLALFEAGTAINPDFAHLLDG